MCKIIPRIAVAIVALVLLAGSAEVLGEEDRYLDDARQQCKAASDIFSCGKYRMLKYVSTLTDGVRADNATTASTTARAGGAGGLVNLIKISDTVPDYLQLFPESRQLTGETEFNKFVKFLQRQVNTFLGSHGLTVPLPAGPRIIDVENPNEDLVSEARGKKKKLQILLPLIILMKVFKIKVLLGVALFAILFIKKAVLFAALVIPSYLSHLKICKVQHHSAGHWADEVHDDYGGGGGGTGWGGHYTGGYGGHGSKEWSAAARAYRAQIAQARQ